MSQYLDRGLDYNKDKHCDVDGWFVDKNGHHQPILREYKNKFGGPLYAPNELYKYFSAFGYYSGLNLNPLLNYSLNNDFKTSSPQINNYLRNSLKYDRTIEESITQIDKLEKLFILKCCINVFRGISFEPENKGVRSIVNLKEGDVYCDKGFMSTSYSMEHALKYAQEKGMFPIILDISLKKGTHCIPLFDEDSGYHSSSTNNEYEILVNRNTKFLVKKKELLYPKPNKNPLLYIRLEAI